MNTTTATLAQVPGAVRAALRSSLGPTLRSTLSSATRSLDAWAGLVDDTWSLTELRARVLRVIDEAPGTRTFVLRTNRNWPGHLPGQHATLEVEIDGVRHRRCYSISSGSTGRSASPFSWDTAARGSRELAITVKRAPGGRVSGWLLDHLHPGDVVRLGPPAGELLLPGEPADAGRALLISAGSGVTPLMAMLRSLAAADRVDDVWFIHHARTRREVIFAAELERLAHQQPGLHLWIAVGDEPQSGGRFDEEELARRVPDFAGRPTRLCGPASFMERVDRMWEAAGASENLRRERFQLAGPTTLPGATTGGARLTARLDRSGRTVEVSGGEVLLTQLERAGANPPSGCRMGICRSCQCRKRSGVVRNVLTGAVSSEPDEEIQLCVSLACTDVVLAS